MAAAACKGMTFNPETNALICACGKQMIALAAITPGTSEKARRVALHIIYEDNASVYADALKLGDPKTKVFAYGRDPLPLDITIDVLRNLMLFAPKR